jgi:ABC-2 type transport system ATP-binding protein
MPFQNPTYNSVMTPIPAIVTHHLRKEFNSKVAVANLSLTVERGEVFGFLGPNGAGKTTSIKMLLGLIAPTAGSGQMLASPLGDNATRARVGFLPEHFRFPDWLTATEFLTLHGKLYHMDTGLLRRKVPDLLDLVNLGRHAGKRLRAFSKGMLQRVGLAQALLNEPDLVLLDEPTSGLDPGGRRLVRDIIRDLRANGTAVFLNSHFLSEVEITCDRVAFIKEGVVIRTSTLSDLVEGEMALQIRARNLMPEVLAGLSVWDPGVHSDGEHLTMTLNDEALLPVINRYLVEHGTEVYAFSPQKISLEDLFLKVVGDGGDGS